MSPESPFSRAADRVADGADLATEAGKLAALLTDDELLGMLDGDVPFWAGLIDMANGGYHQHTWPAAAVPRLGIPGFHFSDGPRGVVIGNATCFPVPMARGATFDPELEHEIGEAIGQELRATGATYYGGVCVNLLRHPGWGRAQETYGEDPLHVGRFGAALSQGVQHWALACVKHFALNSMENARFSVDVSADERALHEVYLPHFKAAIDAGTASVMSAYNSVNGAWAGENNALLTEILRDEWGFDGFVISDFIFGLRDAVRSVSAGLDIEMPFRQQRAIALPAALVDGSLSRADALLAAERIIRTLLRFDAVLAKPAPAASVLQSDRHRALALRAAQESIVLLTNEGPTVPLDPSLLQRVAVLGRLAAIRNLGDGGSSAVGPAEVCTPLDGLRAALAEQGTAIVHDDTDASIAGDADVVIVVVGLTRVEEGEYIDNDGTADLMDGIFPPADHPEVGRSVPLPHFPDPPEPFTGDPDMARGGDRRTLRLSADDEELIQSAVAEAGGAPVIVAVMGGSAVTMPWADTVQVVLQLWYPGQEGGHALADILFGHVPPSGRLPFAIPRHETDLVHFDPDATEETYGLLHGQWWLDANDTIAHFPFGHGLSTTTLRLVSAERVDDTEVRVTVANKGDRDGVEVVQIYASAPDSDYERPRRRLVGFRRALVASNQTESISVPVDLSVLDLRIDGEWLREVPWDQVVLTAAQHATDPGLSC